MNEVVVRLVGGLGNQMFQYAAARAVAHRCDAPLMLDVSWFSDAKDRSYALAPFRIQAGILAPDKSRMPWGQPVQRLVTRFAGLIGFPRINRSVYREKSFRYDPDVRTLKAPVYLDGYFQSEKYFDDCKQTIVHDFELNSPPRGETQAMLDRILVSDAICVHIRRGDYVSNAATNAYHGVCSMEYYQRGLADVAANLEKPHCFVFSDDPVWVRDNLKLDLPMTQVDIHGLEDAHEDLRLMAACHSFVIANSSLSWWGAWLGGRDGKRVVAPARWFQSNDLDTRDLIPDDWIRV